MHDRSLPYRHTCTPFCLNFEHCRITASEFQPPDGLRKYHNLLIRILVGWTIGLGHPQRKLALCMLFCVGVPGELSSRLGRLVTPAKAHT